MPSNQTHTRNWIFRYLPFESTLHSVPYTPHRWWGSEVIRFLDLHCMLTDSDAFMVEGRKKAEVMLYSPGRIEEMVFLVSTYANANTIRISDWLGSARLHLRKDDLAPGEAVGGILRFRPSFPYRVHPCFLGPYSQTFWTYDLTIETSEGYIPKILFPDRSERTYWGCRVSYLGTGECLDDGFYRMRLLRADLPEALGAAEEIVIEVTVRNESPFEWPNAGPARVRLCYRWLDPGGKIVKEGRRSELITSVPAGRDGLCNLRIVAPGDPGAYDLQIDGLVEHVSWFADKQGAPLRQARVRIEAASGKDEESKSK